LKTQEIEHDLVQEGHQQNPRLDDPEAA